jgi:DNA mismatch repair ATPase MutS
MNTKTTEIQEELASAVVLRKALSYALECYPHLMTYISEIALSERAGRSLLRYIEALERIAEKAENVPEFKSELKILQEIVKADPYNMIQEVKPLKGERSRG